MIGKEISGGGAAGQVVFQWGAAPVVTRWIKKINYCDGTGINRTAEEKRQGCIQVFGGKPAGYGV